MTSIASAQVAFGSPVRPLSARLAAATIGELTVQDALLCVAASLVSLGRITEDMHWQGVAA